MKQSKMKKNLILFRENFCNIRNFQIIADEKEKLYEYRTYKQIERKLQTPAP